MKLSLNKLVSKGLLSKDTKEVTDVKPSDIFEYVFGKYAPVLPKDLVPEWLAHAPKINTYYIGFENGSLGTYALGADVMGVKILSRSGRLVMKSVPRIGEASELRKYFKERKMGEKPKRKEDKVMETNQVLDSIKNKINMPGLNNEKREEKGVSMPGLGDFKIPGNGQTQGASEMTSFSGANASRGITAEGADEDVEMYVRDLHSFNRRLGGHMGFICDRASRLSVGTENRPKTDANGKFVYIDETAKKQGETKIAEKGKLSKADLKALTVQEKVLVHKASAPSKAKAHVITIPEGGFIPISAITEAIQTKQKVQFDRSKETLLTKVLEESIALSLISTRFGGEIVDRSAYGNANNNPIIECYSRDRVAYYKPGTNTRAKASDEDKEQRIVQQPIFKDTTKAKLMQPGRFIARLLDETIDISDVAALSDEQRKTAAISLYGNLLNVIGGADEPAYNGLADSQKELVNLDGGLDNIYSAYLDPAKKIPMNVKSPFKTGEILLHLEVPVKEVIINEPKEGKKTNNKFRLKIKSVDFLKEDSISRTSLNPQGKYKDVIAAIGENNLSLDAIKVALVKTKATKSEANKAKVMRESFFKGIKIEQGDGSVSNKDLRMQLGDLFA